LHQLPEALPLLAARNSTLFDLVLGPAKEVQVFYPHLSENVSGDEGDSYSKELKIICWVASIKKRIKVSNNFAMQGKLHSLFQLAKAAAETWGEECEVFYIMLADPLQKKATVVSRAGRNVFLVKFAASASYERLWKRTQLAMHFVWGRHGIAAFDFLLKADDDTFVDMKGLSKFLNTLDEKENLFIGHPFQADEVIKSHIDNDC